MNISRQTFGNILHSAHKKIAEALIKSKVLKIEGGVYMIAKRKFIYYACNHTWEVPYGTGRPTDCHQCKSTNIHRTPEDRGYARIHKHGPRCGRGGYGRGL